MSAVEMDLRRHLREWDEAEALDEAIEDQLRQYTQDATGFLDLTEGMTRQERNALDAQLAAFLTVNNRDVVGIGRIQERMQKLFEAVIQRDLERAAREDS